MQRDQPFQHGCHVAESCNDLMTLGAAIRAASEGRAFDPDQNEPGRKNAMLDQSKEIQPCLDECARRGN
jgi:hypothetical protein